MSADFHQPVQHSPLEPFPLFIDSAPPNSANYFSSPMAMAAVQLLASSSSSHPRKPRLPRISMPAKVSNYIRLRYYQYEVTFGVYVMTPNEKLIFNSIVLIVLAALFYALFWGFEPFFVNMGRPKKVDLYEHDDKGSKLAWLDKSLDYSAPGILFVSNFKEQRCLETHVIALMRQLVHRRDPCPAIWGQQQSRKSASNSYAAILTVRHTTGLVGCFSWRIPRALRTQYWVLTTMTWKESRKSPPPFDKDCGHQETKHGSKNVRPSTS